MMRLLVLALLALTLRAERLDLAPFARPCCARAVALQYWFRNWPYPPPQAPDTEDPVDDPWQGEWITAKTEVSRECVLTFQLLETSENKRAAAPERTFARAARKIPPPDPIARQGGPLSPEDPGRSEQTPAVLMLKISARGRSAAPVHLWIAMGARCGTMSGCRWEQQRGWKGPHCM